MSPISDHVKRYLKHEISTGKLLELIPERHDLVGAFGQAFDDLNSPKETKLAWEDLNINTNFRGNGEWRDVKGKLKVHVSIKNASFVMHTFWIKDWTPEKPETKAAILLEMNRTLSRIYKSIERFFPT